MSEEKDEDARNPACLYDQYFSTPMVVIKKKKNFSSDVLSTVRHHHPVPTDRPEYKQFLDFSVMPVVKISSITKSLVIFLKSIIHINVRLHPMEIKL